jgi:hypothetical protein
MQAVQGRRDWAFEEFRNCGLADARWRRRLVEMAARAARRPAGRVTETFSDDAQRQGAYGLLESDAVAPEQVASAMFSASALRSAEHPFVFCPVDGTSLRLVDRDRSKDFGSVGSHSKGARGLKVMNAMVLSPDGVPLGLSAQKWWARPHRRRRKHRDRLPPERKETGHWLEVMQQTRQLMADHAPSTRCWFQLDREGDAWPMLTEAGLAGHWFTIRSGRNRRVRSAHGRRCKLRQLLAEQPVLTRTTLHVRAAPNRQARMAALEIRACTTTLDLRDKRTERRFTMTVNVIQIRERHSTPSGEKPIEWTLLTNHPIATAQDLSAVIFGYSMRWRIEELHRSWKSGACNVEQTQLRSTGAVIKWATILIAVAARIERIKQLSREQPERPATDEFSPVEIRAVALLRFGKAAKTRVPDGTVPTIEQVTLWIAQIGGYTGRASSGGPPGSITLARGLKDVRAAAQALEAAAL